MSFLGNQKGPRLSDILNRLGPEYFGITQDQLMNDVSCAEENEMAGRVNPVYVDGAGMLCYRFSGSEGQQVYAFTDDELEGMVTGSAIMVENLPKGLQKSADDILLARLATRVVRDLSLEDLQDHLEIYGQKLVAIGEPAIRPLQDFLAIEQERLSVVHGPKELYPTKSNYDAARAVLAQIQNQAH